MTIDMLVNTILHHQTVPNVMSDCSDTRDAKCVSVCGSVMQLSLIIVLAMLIFHTTSVACPHFARASDLLGFIML